MLSGRFSPVPRPSYMLLVPRSLQWGVPTTVSVTILSGSPVTVSALIHHDNRVVAADSITVEAGDRIRTADQGEKRFCSVN